MKLNCAVAGDLLPLYLENMCSEETKAALEEHLRECPHCREKAARMEKSGLIPQEKAEDDRLRIAGYAQKVKRHRLRVGISAALVGVFAVCALSLVCLTVIDMHREANPPVHQTEEGVYDLTAAELETTAEDVGQYVFYTNYAKIKVTVKGEGDFHGAIMLWNTENGDSFIQVHEVDAQARSYTFTGLSAAQRYKVTCQDLAGATIAVSDGREVSFTKSLMRVLGEIFGG